MKCNVLISTMNRDNCEELAKQMKVKEYVMINQITKSSITPTNIDSEKCKIISVKEKGLSKSRNKAIKNAKSDICLIADDDMFYYENYEETVLNAYNEFTDADMIAFVVTHENKKTKKILKKGRVGFLNSNRIQSVQLSFKKDSIINNNIKFDEKFGAGSKYNFGEENIFMADCIKKGLKIYFYPVIIANLKDTGTSTWFKGYTKEYFYNRGALYKRMSPKIYIIMIIQFALRKRKLYSEKVSVKEAIKLMLCGSKDYGDIS